MTTARDHEWLLVKSFIIPQRQSRYLELIEKPKRRKEIALSPAYFKRLDMRYAFTIPSQGGSAEDIVKLLKEKSALDICYALSEDNSVDGNELPLGDAIEFILGRGIGTFLSCVPARLAYFEDEDARFILERKK